MRAPRALPSPESLEAAPRAGAVQSLGGSAFQSQRQAVPPLILMLAGRDGRNGRGPPTRSISGRASEPPSALLGAGQGVGDP
eukprot:333626-Pyramimonas_sp.AAC.1